MLDDHAPAKGCLLVFAIVFYAAIGVLIHEHYAHGYGECCDMSGGRIDP